MRIRQFNFYDLGHIRALPVQLAQPSTKTLRPKKIRVMMTNANMRLLICETGGRVSGFMAVTFVPGEDRAACFMLIEHFALDRLSISLGVALEMEEYAATLARDAGVNAILAPTEKLSRPVIRHYQTSGYTLTGETLMKKLQYA